MDPVNVINWIKNNSTSDKVELTGKDLVGAALQAIQDNCFNYTIFFKQMDITPWEDTQSHFLTICQDWMENELPRRNQDFYLAIVNGIKGEPMKSLQKAIEEYLKFKYELTETTKAIYREHLERLCTHLNNPTLNEIDHWKLSEFMSSLKPQKKDEYKPAVKDQIYRSLKTFFNFCVQEEWIDKNPMNRVKKPRVPKGPKPKLSLIQIAQIIDNIEQSERENKQRDLAIILLMLDSGVRLNEVVNLQIKDLDLSDKEITVYSEKTNRRRIVPISRKTQKAIETYMAQRQNEGSLFLSKNGEPITKKTVIEMVRRLKLQTHLDIHPHLFRHTFARHYINQGELKKLQQILGHSTVSTTADFYATADLTAIKAEFDLCSPIAQMGEEC